MLHTDFRRDTAWNSDRQGQKNCSDVHTKDRRFRFAVSIENLKRFFLNSTNEKLSNCQESIEVIEITMDTSVNVGALYIRNVVIGLHICTECDN